MWLEQFAGRGDRRPDIKDARPQTGNLKSPTSETGAKQHRAGTGFAASGRAADGHHEPHRLAARNDPTHGVPWWASLPTFLTPTALPNSHTGSEAIGQDEFNMCNALAAYVASKEGVRKMDIE